MTPAEIINEIRAEGIALTLSDNDSIKVRGAHAIVSRWLGVIQKQKPGIVVALREAATNGPRVGAANIVSASHGWLIHYATCEPVEVYSSPAATQAEVLAAFAGSVAAFPIPGTLRRPTTPDQEAELRALINLVLGRDAEAQWIEALAAACAHPEAAIASFRALVDDQHLDSPPAPSGRRNGPQCADPTPGRAGALGDPPGMSRREVPADRDDGCLLPPDPAPPPPLKPVRPLPRVPSMPTIEYVTSAERATLVLAELLLQQPLGLDIETTGLDPLQHQIRLLQLACRSGRVAVFDLFRLPAALFAPISNARLVAHNAVFEYAFLAVAGIRLELLDDSMLMYRTLHGHTASLQEAVQKVLLLSLDKAEQTSDWTEPALTERQLNYAARDAWAALRLGEALEPGHTLTYRLAMQALPVVAQCHLDGVPFDWEQHAALCKRSEHELTEAEKVLQKQLGPTTNPRSTQQIEEWLRQRLDAAILEQWPRTPTGKLQLDRDVLTRYATHPVLGPLARQRTLQKLLSVYGHGYLKHRHPITQRIHPHYRILGTAAGRFSCSNPNIQQLPADYAMRQLVRADPGRRLVCADFSQIELRIGALLSRDPRLLDAYSKGEDLHAQTAKALCGDAAQRQLGKCANFGLLFGSGAAGLQAFAKNKFGVDLTPTEAMQHRDRFLQTYAGLRQWQIEIDSAARRSRTVHTRAGLIRVLEPYRMTEALNTPVQGSAAEVLLAALGRLPHWLRGLNARLVLHCHDELVLDCAELDAPAAATALTNCMTEAWQRLFPEAVMPGICEAHIGGTWADAKKG